MVFSRLAAIGLILFAGSDSLAKELVFEEAALTVGERSWKGPSEWKVGEQVWLRVVVTGFGRGRSGEADLRGDFLIRDSSDRELAVFRSFLRFHHSIPRSADSIQLVNQFTVPADLSPGLYRVEIRCRDGIGSKEVATQLPFVVGAGGRLSIPRFVVRSTRVDVRRARVGLEATVSGYETIADSYWIEVDLQLADPSSGRVIRWNNVLEDKGKSKPTGLPLLLSFDLDLPDFYAPGDYELLLTVRDRLAGSQAVRTAPWTKR